MKKVALLSVASVAGFGFAAGDAWAQAETCSRAGDVRVIEVISPGSVGAACDVRVTRDGGAQVNTPYHANVDRNFCRAMAAELASQLTLEGFECKTAASAAVEAALAGGEAPQGPIEQKLSELPLDQQAEQMGLAAAPAEAKPAPALRAEPAPQPAPIASAVPSLDGIIEPEAPLSAPVVLTEGAHPAATRAPRPKRNGAGRLVGAQPSLDDIIDVTVAANGAATPVLASGGAPLQRLTEDIIKGVIAANAAAWNEGNLTAFLSGYEQGASVRLVNGAEIVTGINAVRKYYQTLVQSAGAMGRLSFSDLDVSMTAPEIATVVGRFAHDAGAARTAGAMTLVMKQIDGRWRIVQDTRVKDADVPTLAPVN
ncbi:MAG: YybH family protein [Parvularculaceae bacterium]